MFLEILRGNGYFGNELQARPQSAIRSFELLYSLMSPLYIEGLGVLLLILLVGFFSASEVAVLSTRKSRIKELAEQGNRNAGIVLDFQSNPEQFLATVHVGIVFSLILASGLGGVMGVQHLQPALQESETQWIREGSAWLALGIIVISIGSIVFGLGVCHRVDFGLG